MGPEGQVQDQTKNLSLKSLVHRAHNLLKANSDPDGGDTTKPRREQKFTVK